MTMVSSKLYCIPIVNIKGWNGPRDLDIPDTEDPEVLRNLEFISPKAGVYRPIHSSSSRAAAKKDKCSVM